MNFDDIEKTYPDHYFSFIHNISHFKGAHFSIEQDGAETFLVGVTKNKCKKGFRKVAKMLEKPVKRDEEE